MMNKNKATHTNGGVVLQKIMFYVFRIMSIGLRVKYRRKVFIIKFNVATEDLLAISEVIVRFE